jgi:hypothetical protein
MPFGWLRRPSRWDGSAGVPPSGNGASSFHLSWVLDPAPPDGWVAVEAVLEVQRVPQVRALSFWALQASFTDRGRHGGAGHLGLQWHPDHPGSTAVNWGGYGADGRELVGSAATLPSATGNVNTRDLAWTEGVAYRLRISASGAAPTGDGRTAWRGEVTDLTRGATVVVRDLWAAGTSLDAPVVWSEVFARCDDPTSIVRWSGLRMIAADGASSDARRVRVNYQSLADGGCTTTDSSPDAVGVVQTTGTTRRTPQGAVFDLPDQARRS